MTGHRGGKPPTAITTPEEGAAWLRGALIDRFDRKDGTGANWKLMVDSVFKAGFDLADTKLDETTQAKLWRRLHQGSYNRISEEGLAGKRGSPEDDPDQSITRDPEPSLDGPRK